MAFGALTGLVWLVLMAFSLLTGVGERTLTTIGGFHPFFGYSWGGAAVIAVEHMIGGSVLGFLFATLYNKFLKPQ